MLRKLLTGVIVLGCIARVLAIIVGHPMDYILLDAERHWVSGELFFSPTLWGSNDPILFQFYVWAIRCLSGDSATAIAVCTCVLSVSMPWTFYRAAREFGLPKIQSLVVWCIIVWAPSVFSIYHYMMIETLILPFVGAGLWATARYLRKRTFGSHLVHTAVWVLACLTKATVVPMAAVCLIFGWYQCRRLWQVIASILLGATMLLPNAFKTTFVLGFPAPFGNIGMVRILHASENQSLHLTFKAPNHVEYSGTTPEVTVQLIFAPFSNWVIPRQGTVNVTVDRDNGAKDWQAAIQAHQPSFQVWLSHLRDNIVTFLFAPSWPDDAANGCSANHPAKADLLTRSNLGGWLSEHTRWVWAPVILFVLAFSFREFFLRRYHPLLLATACLILCSAFQNAGTYEGRYRKPLEPVLCLCLVWSLSRQRRPNYPAPPAHEWSFGHTRSEGILVLGLASVILPSLIILSVTQPSPRRVIQANAWTATLGTSQKQGLAPWPYEHWFLQADSEGRIAVRQSVSIPESGLYQVGFHYTTAADYIPQAQFTFGHHSYLLNTNTKKVRLPVFFKIMYLERGTVQAHYTAMATSTQKLLGAGFITLVPLFPAPL